MSYAKSFSCIITVYPEFYKDVYSEYLKEKINNWISECFLAYNSYFKIKIIQHNLISYEYDSEKDRRDINFKKLWSSPYGKYSIIISAAGIIHKGITNSINPPLNIIENVIDKITFRYQEINDDKSPIIIAYGKGIGIPMKYCCDDILSEYWISGFNNEDGYCSNWHINLSCTKENYNEAKKLIIELLKLNSNKDYDMDDNPYEYLIDIKTCFFLNNIDKTNYLKLLNELSLLVIEDDGVNIDSCSMNFVSQQENVYSLETYYFDELSGKFVVKNTAPV